MAYCSANQLILLLAYTLDKTWASCYDHGQIRDHIPSGVMTMPEIGVLELKTHASAIIRSVREQRTRYVITRRGKPVGLLLPLDEGTYPAGTDVQAGGGAWDELVRLGEEIGRGWPPDLTGAEVVSAMRR